MTDEEPEPQVVPKQNSSASSVYLLFMLLFMVIMFIPQLRLSLGIAAGYVFTPLFSFGGRYPIYTILSTGVVLTLINVWARHHFTDWIQMAKIQNKMKAFNKVYREAVMKQNAAKIAKLKKLQTKYMAESMDSQSRMMKSTMITLLIVIAIFTWLWTFMQYIAMYTYMAVPWDFTVNMNSSMIFPSWLWMYSAITMPLAWIVQYIFKYFEFKKRLEEDKQKSEYGELVKEEEEERENE